MARARRLLPVLLLLLSSSAVAVTGDPRQRPLRSRETLVLQTTHGTLRLKLWPEVAPKTSAHVLRLFELGLYQTNHFFRVDSGFVAQVADVESGRRAPIDDVEQRAAAAETVPLEAGVGKRAKGSDASPLLWPKHDRQGLLSMARTADPDSGRSSFSVLLGAAPHLDGQYTLFGEVDLDTREQRNLFERFRERLEALPTRKEGIFVMPTERVEIVSTYVIKDGGGGGVVGGGRGTTSGGGGGGGGVGRDEELIQCLRELSVMEARWKSERARSRASSLAASAIP